jgi:hypothetical protein
VSPSPNARVEVGEVPWTTSDAPSVPRWVAITRPSPRDEPVTQATFPASGWYDDTDMVPSECQKSRGTLSLRLIKGGWSRLTGADVP